MALPRLRGQVGDAHHAHTGNHAVECMGAGGSEGDGGRCRPLREDVPFLAD